MEKLRKIEFYTSDKYDPQAGFMDGGDEDDNKTAIGLFHRFADSYQKELEKPYLRNSEFDPFDNRASLVYNYWSCFRYRSNYFQSLFW